ncbi:MAG: hypothetical protein EAZ40_03565 [Rhodobacterales bacterium]|nr:MAG: hypothetical protein EAZ40_03565 [Rhodobacterales bacterium]
MPKPEFAAWLMEKAPWLGDWMAWLAVICVIAAVASNWPLLKHGPRHWWVTRKWEFRKWKRKDGR